MINIELKLNIQEKDLLEWVIREGINALSVDPEKNASDIEALKRVQQKVSDGIKEEEKDDNPLPEACGKCSIEPVCPVYNGCHLCEHIDERMEYINREKENTSL